MNATNRYNSNRIHESPKMIHSIQIRGYRGFSLFAMSGLGDINLLVGTNNSGKTSVLEALYLLASAGDPGALWQVLSRRGERLEEESAPRRPDVEFDVSHLFHGHEIRPGATFSIYANNQLPERAINYVIGEVSRKENREMFPPEGDGPLGPRLGIHVTGKPDPLVPVIPLSRRGGLAFETFDLPRRRRGAVEGATPAQFISTESLSRDELTRMWGKVVLTDAEVRVLRALRFLDPSIERIANIPTSSNFYASRGGFLIKRNSEPPVPIGSMGDGMWRVLALAIALSRSQDGILLVDEIDTGLHYTVMSDMWRLVADTARELRVQIFATTHSYDCVKSLAEICDTGISSQTRITIQRIEPEQGRSVPYSEHEIRVAAERQIEVR